MKIRIFKNRKNVPKCWTIGAVKKDKETKEELWHFTRTFGENIDFFEMSDDEFFDRDGEPIPVLEVLAAFYKQNRGVPTYPGSGRLKRTFYGEDGKWFIDYQPELKEFFEENKIPVPIDGRSHSDRIAEGLALQAKAQGYTIRGLSAENPGQAAIDHAKLQAEVKKREALEKEIAELKAGLAEKEIASKKASASKADKEKKEGDG